MEQEINNTYQERKLWQITNTSLLKNTKCSITKVRTICHTRSCVKILIQWTQKSSSIPEHHKKEHVLTKWIPIQHFLKMPEHSTTYDTTNTNYEKDNTMIHNNSYPTIPTTKHHHSTQSNKNPQKHFKQTKRPSWPKIKHRNHLQNTV